MQDETQEARFRLREEEGVPTAVALDHGTHGSPMAAVVGELHRVTGRERVIEPVQDQTSELTGLPKIDRQHLLRAGGRIALPGGRESPVERVSGFRSRLNRGRLQHGRGLARRLRRQLANAELVETHRTSATTASCLDHELKRRAVLERAIGRRSPGELDLSPLDLDRLPLVWEFKVTAVDPPHVLAARIDELEFKVVHRRLTADVKGELVIGRQVDRQRTADTGIAGDPFEVEVEAHGLPLKALDGVERRQHAVRGADLPQRQVLESVEYTWRLCGDG